MSGGEGITVDVILPMEKAGSERVRRAAVARKLGISPSRIRDLRLVKESIDSRQKKILFQLRLLVGVDSPLPPERLPSRDYPSVRPGSPVALIVGFGPAGMFAALRCLELGMKPVVLERGKDVSSRLPNSTVGLRLSRKQSVLATASATQKKPSNAEKPHKHKEILCFLLGWGSWGKRKWFFFYYILLYVFYILSATSAPKDKNIEYKKGKRTKYQ